MSKISESVLSPQPRNHNARMLLEQAMNDVSAARVNLGRNPKATVVSLDHAAAKIVTVMRGLDASFDFGIPSATPAKAEDDRVKLIQELELENTNLRNRIAELSKPVAVSEDAEEAPAKRRGRPRRSAEVNEASVEPSETPSESAGE